MKYLLILSIFFIQVSFADKWIDADGYVHYGTNPNKPNVSKYEGRDRIRSYNYNPSASKSYGTSNRYYKNGGSTKYKTSTSRGYRSSSNGYYYDNSDYNYSTRGKKVTYKKGDTSRHSYSNNSWVNRKGYEDRKREKCREAEDRYNKYKKEGVTRIDPISDIEVQLRGEEAERALSRAKDRYKRYCNYGASYR